VFGNMEMQNKSDERKREDISNRNFHSQPLRKKFSET
jgi:hypothetical protein